MLNWKIKGDIVGYFVVWIMLQFLVVKGMDPCEGNPCGVGARECFRNQAGDVFFCSCLDGTITPPFTPCSVPTGVCENNPCSNGTCTDTGDTFSCLCNNGYTKSIIGVCDVETNNDCPTGLYGLQCDIPCNCIDEDACFSSGFCLRGCQSGYVGDNCNKDGTPIISRFSYEEKVNNNTKTMLMCSIVGNPLPPESFITVYNSNNTAVARRESKLIRRYYTIENTYPVVVLEPGENFTCALTLSDGSIIQEGFFVDVYSPPSINSPPTIDPSAITPYSLTINWNQWDSTMTGDGPIEKYIVKYRPMTSKMGNQYPNVTEIEANVTLLEVAKLNWDTDYEFVVIAARPGEGGEGQPSPIARVTTACDVPLEAATITQVRAMNSSALLIHWKLPSPTSWRCRKLQDVRVTWKEADSNVYPEENVQLVDPKSTMILTRLKSCVTYDVRLQLRNSDNLAGPLSGEMNGTTLTSDLIIDAVNTSFVSLRWKMPECALPITKELLFLYQPENQTLLASTVAVQDIRQNVEYLEIHHLQAGQKYKIVMQILTTDDNMYDIGIVEISTLREDCYAEKQTLSWPKTMAGESTDSIELCPQYSAKAGTPRGSRLCVVGPDSQPLWLDPIIINCFEGDEMTMNEQLEMISGKSVNENNVEEVSTDLEFLSDTTDNIDAGDLESIAKTLENIADVQDSSPQVTMSVVSTIDNILDLDNQEFQDSMATNSPTRILRSLESQISAQQKQGGNFTHTGRNINVKAVQVKKRKLQSGVGFAQVDDDVQKSGDKMRKTGRVFFDTDEVPVDESDVAIILPDITFMMTGKINPTPSMMPSSNMTIDTMTNDTMTNATMTNDTIVDIPDEPDVPITFIIYQNSKLFQSNRLPSESSCSERTQRVVGTRIIAASIDGVKIANLPPDSVVINGFAPLEIWENGELDNYQCVFWDFDLDDRNGDWSSEGCHLAPNVTLNRTICYCDHLTSFAVLMDFRGQTKTSIVLTLISTIGCGISVAALIITIVTYLSMKSLRSNPPSRILLCLSVSLLCLYLVFLIGIDQTQSFGGCVTVAVFLHYFTLTSVCWMAVEAVNLYLLVVRVFNNHVKYFLLKSSLFAWGLPCLIVSTVLAIDYFQYCNTSHCFMQVGMAFYFANLLPMFVVLTFNVIIFILVIHKLTCGRKFKKAQTNVQNTREQNINRALNALAISGLLGITWIFGFFTIIDTANMAFQVLFTVCNSIQGLFIFILFCVRQKEVRQAWQRCFSEDGKKKDFVKARVEMSNASRFTPHHKPNV